MFWSENVVTTGAAGLVVVFNVLLIYYLKELLFLFKIFVVFVIMLLLPLPTPKVGFLLVEVATAVSTRSFFNKLLLFYVYRLEL